MKGSGGAAGAAGGAGGATVVGSLAAPVADATYATNLLIMSTLSCYFVTIELHIYYYFE